MPHSSDRIYARLVNGVIMGISVQDVAAVLGASSLDVGTLCTHPNINGLSRYRPVRRGENPSPGNQTAIFNSGTRFWDEDATLSNNWFYGLNFEGGRAIEAPDITSWQSFLRPDNTVYPSAKWQFNLPRADDFKHLDHFHGYNHKAVPAFYGWVRSDAAHTFPNQVSYKGKIVCGFSFVENDSNQPVGKEDGCWNAKELLGLIGRSYGGTLYLGLALRITKANGGNNGYPIRRCGTVGKIDFTDIDPAESVTFDVEVNNQSSINSGGVGTAVSVGDIIDAMVFVSQSEIQDSMSSDPNGFSLYVDDEHTGYKRLEVVHDTTNIEYVNLYYYWSMRDALYSREIMNVEVEGGSCFINTADFTGSDNGKILEFSEVLGAMTNTFADITTTERYRNVKIGKYVDFTSDGNEANFSWRFAEVQTGSIPENGKLAASLIIPTNFPVYRSLADARARINSVELGVVTVNNGDQTLQGGMIPIPEYEYGSSGTQKWAITGGKIEVNLSISTTQPDSVSGNYITRFISNSIYTGYPGIKTIHEY